MTGLHRVAEFIGEVEEKVEWEDCEAPEKAEMVKK